MNRETAFLKTPIGTLEISGNDKGIQTVTILKDDIETSKNIPEILKVCVAQLQEYFEGKRTNFTLKLNPKGTNFQQKVWQELQNIPFAKTITYKEQSKTLGNLKAIRAVASANGKNPILIIIPCHRVVGSNGSLTGFSAGLWRKKWLLDHEKPTKQKSLF